MLMMTFSPIDSAFDGRLQTHAAADRRNELEASVDPRVRARTHQAGTRQARRLQHAGEGHFVHHLAARVFAR